MALVVRNLLANAGDSRDMVSVPVSGRFPRGGNGTQFPCLDNSMDRGAWWATVHGGAKRVDMTEHAHTVVGVCFGPPKCFLKC